MSRYFTEKFAYTKATFGSIPSYTFKMKVKDLVAIYYVAVRGIDHEEGSVQRVLSKRRVASITDYILDGNTFFNSFILNWTDSKNLPSLKEIRTPDTKDVKAFLIEKVIELKIVPASAQVIDGQHRIAGFELAMEEDSSVGDREVIVTMCLNLSTSEAAAIFLNINTEQKPVPKSLMYDLFGEVDSIEDHGINRATDIARTLNEDENSPLYKQLKFPGNPRGVGSIELSTFVSAFKEHLKPSGTFSRFNLKSFDHQKSVISNYFTAIKKYYDEKKWWTVKSKNPFLKAAGFNGAVDFLTGSLIEKCSAKASFSVTTISELIAFDTEDLLTWDELKGLDGKTSRTRVKKALEANLIAKIPSQNEYEF